MQEANQLGEDVDSLKNHLVKLLQSKANSKDTKDEAKEEILKEHDLWQNYKWDEQVGSLVVYSGTGWGRPNLDILLYWLTQTSSKTLYKLYLILV